MIYLSFLPENVESFYPIIIPYDFKNRLEDLCSENTDNISFPYIKNIHNQEIKVNYSKLKKKSLENKISHQIFFVQPRVKKNEYLENIHRIQQHIQQGDIYEMNYCIEFYAENVVINPYRVFVDLYEQNKAPFSCFVEKDNRFLMCAGPERFIKKTGNKIISQPIKGTAKRGKNAEEDEMLKNNLRNSIKEQSENVMIVDLVRNDLSKIAKRNSVKVEKLFGIYTFETVHQMISTISAELRENVTFDEIIKATFPMGSMTGAPKIRAMELIEKYEITKRGLYSGAVGYLLPNGDFDLNVVIRGIQYNADTKYLSIMVGGAITALSNPESEWEECLLKAQGMFKALNAELSD